MSETHNYFWGGWPEMPWKKDKEDEVNIWPDPDIEEWENTEEDDREED